MNIKSSIQYILGRLLCAYRWVGADRLTINRYVASSPVLKLHVGAGSNLLPGWLNSDYYHYKPHVIHIDATKIFPIESNTFDYIFSEHMVEHIPFVGAYNMLQEMHRILKPGGILRISTPDLAFLVGLLSENKSEIQSNYVDWSSSQFTPYAKAQHKAVFVVNNFFYNFGHRFIYTKPLLKDILVEVGFKSVNEQQIMKSSIPEFEGLEHIKKIPDGFLELESMIFEAVK